MAHMPGTQQQRVERGPESPLVAKLETRARLAEEDRDALNALYRDARDVGARRNIIREGDRPDHVHLMVEGWAARYKLLPDGARQITAFLIPGDFCDLHVTILGEMDHGITTLTRSRVAFIPRATMDALTDRASLAKAFWWATLVDEAVLRSWIVNIGRRDAFEAIGHLICELYVRMKNIGLVNGRALRGSAYPGGDRRRARPDLRPRQPGASAPSGRRPDQLQPGHAHHSRLPAAGEGVGLQPQLSPHRAAARKPDRATES